MPLPLVLNVIVVHADLCSLLSYLHISVSTAFSASTTHDDDSVIFTHYSHVILTKDCGGRGCMRASSAGLRERLEPESEQVKPISNLWNTPGASEGNTSGESGHNTHSATHCGSKD